MQDLLQKAMESATYIMKKINEKPDVVVVLGSGLGKLADEIRNPIEISYNEIPNFKISNVVGHENKLIYGTIYNKKVLAMKGRYHYYEGYSMQEVTFPIRVFALLGIQNIILTNAAGAINKKYNAGDLMLINDHLKLCADSPLRGLNADEFGTRFPNMTDAYSKDFLNLAKSVAKTLKIDLQEGVYAFMPGPQYETLAELKMLSILGADAVGMSTVPEVITAVHSGMNVLGVSCITNETGTDKPLSHKDVTEVATGIEKKFTSLIVEIINKI